MKKTIITTILVLLSISLFSQDQTKSDIILQTGESKLTPLGQEGKRLYFGAREDNGDYIYMTRFNRDTNKSDLRVGIGDDAGGDDRFIVGNITWNSGGVWKDWFVVTNQARVGIGVSYPTCALDINGAVKASALDVAGTIRSKEVKIEAAGWADFVFDRDYKLPSLSQVESHINENKTLPGIPTEQQVKENGVDLGDMQIKLLQKIEELTLYVIDQDKRIKALEEENKNLKNTQP